MDEKLARGLIIGAIAAMALVMFGPQVAAGARPLVRRGIKSAVKAYAGSREAFAELQEVAEDAYAEAWAEIHAEAEPAAAKAAASPTARGRAKETVGGTKRKTRKKA